MADHWMIVAAAEGKKKITSVAVFQMEQRPWWPEWKTLD
jgi:hypothetical protein